jgi:hypothetical protein
MSNIRKAGLCLLLLLVWLPAACGGNGQQAKSYGEDGYLGMTNTNPNLPTSPSYHTYAIDTDMMRKAVASIEGVQDVRIMTNGANATVTLTVPNQLPAEEKERIRTLALEQLKHEVPRYKFTVKLIGK